MDRQLKLTDAEHEALARRIHAALRAGKGIDPPSEAIDYTFEDAYRVRRKLVDLLIADGGRPVGHKIGFTSEAMQKMYGMTGPDFGILLDTMIVPEGKPVRVSTLANTRAEPEIAFRLKRPLAGKGVTIDEVLDATDKVIAAIEVIDSRVGAMRAKANDSLADNAGAGLVVLGSVALDPRALKLEDVPMMMDVDGEMQHAVSRDVMGHPAAPLAFLAGKLEEIGGLGGSLKAGDIVITGAPIRSVAVRAGSRLHATFGPLGVIDIGFA